jgi:D-alanine-D-alanine ligase-like ATP-grasp enzyme
MSFANDIYPQIREICRETVAGLSQKLDPKKRLHCFEVYGYDFMVDANFKVWLIEVNTNPCLDTS